MNRIGWDTYFMGIANLTALRSPDLSTKVGSCIVDDENHVVGTGYNGPPKNIDHDLVPSENSNADPLLNKYLFFCHSEENAIYNSGGRNLNNTRIYTTCAPCCECAKSIIQTGIKEVIYLEDKYPMKPESIAGKKLFELAGIKTRQFEKTGIEIKLVL